MNVLYAQTQKNTWEGGGGVLAGTLAKKQFEALFCGIELARYAGAVHEVEGHARAVHGLVAHGVLQRLRDLGFYEGKAVVHEHFLVAALAQAFAPVELAETGESDAAEGQLLAQTLEV